MSSPAIVPLGLSPAPRWGLVLLYASALLPGVGVALAFVLERLLRRSLLAGGRHFGALELRCHLRGAIILGGVWTVALLVRHLLLEAVLQVASL